MARQNSLSLRGHEGILDVNEAKTPPKQQCIRSTKLARMPDLLGRPIFARLLFLTF